MMKNKKEHKTVSPELRFPEFRDTEEWKSDSIGNVCSSYSGGTPTTTEPRYYGGHIPFIRSAEISKNETDLFLTTDGLHNSSAKEVNKGDVLIALYGANSGDVAISKIDGAINQAILCLKSEQSNEFLYQYLTFKKEDIISTFIQGGQGNLSGEIIKSLKLFFPKLNEQKKIADCFSSLDDLISAVINKIEALKEHKKGLMQRLFPTEGSAVPTLRFPEFQSAPEWKETTIGAEMHYENGKAHENDIDKDGEYIVVNSKFISTDGEVIKYTNTPNCLANKGDILMVLSDVPNGRAIAKCFIVDADNKYTVNQRICKLTTKESVGAFLYYIVNRNPYLLSFDDGVKQTNLKKEDVLKCSFMLPRDPKEQQRITNCLTSIDNLITAESEQLEQLEAHKKGLMQRLFPKI